MPRTRRTRRQWRYTPPTHQPSFHSSSSRNRIGESRHEIVDLTNDISELSSHTTVANSGLCVLSEAAAATSQAIAAAPVAMAAATEITESTAATVAAAEATEATVTATVTTTQVMATAATALTTSATSTQAGFDVHSSSTTSTSATRSTLTNTTASSSSSTNRPYVYGYSQYSDGELSIISSTSESEESDSDMSQKSIASENTITKLLEENRNKYIQSAKEGKSKQQVQKRMKNRTETEKLLMAYDSGFSDHQRRVIKQVRVGGVVNCGNKKYEITSIGITPYGSDKISVWGKRRKSTDVGNITTSNINSRLDVNKIRVKRSKLGLKKEREKMKSLSRSRSTTVSDVIGESFNNAREHTIEKKEQTKTRHFKWSYSKAERKCDENLNTVEMEESAKCYLCQNDFRDGYTGNCLCLEKFKTQPAACKECVVLQVMKYKLQYVQCYRCNRKMF